MKKIVALTLALGLSSTAFAAGFEGEGTSHVNLEIKKSSLTREAVVAKADGSDLSNSMDGSPAPKFTPSNVTRVQVVQTMDGFNFNDFGDATTATPWVKKESSKRNLAQSSK